VNGLILDRIEVFGYKRLFRASSYVGRKTVALVGPNEAGKTSVLSALRLFQSEDEVPKSLFSRIERERTRGGDETVVQVSYRLSESHVQCLQALPLSVKPTHVVRYKKVDGRRLYGFSPRPVVDDELRVRTLKVWPALAKALNDRHRTILEEGSEELDSQLERTREAEAALQSPEINPMEWGQIFEHIDAVRVDHPSKGVLAAIDALDEYVKWSGSKTPSSLIWAELGISFPQFALFGGRERSIASEYAVDGDEADESRALQNLLAVAGLSLAKIREHQDDSPYVAQLVQEANTRLATFFAERWSQEALAVGLHLDGDVLRVFVRDTNVGSPGWINIEDRSDGLRMFVALATFLARDDFEVPPILLIDEAEQHLHLNAQADLIRMLQDLDKIQQVIYTTHSPGCLPADLGNGVRFVEPQADGTSLIRHDFWSMTKGGHVGFNPLLMVMGAGSAAFSSLRTALICEGASEMLLLPSLIKAATGKSELSYQIAPGVAVTGKADFPLFDTVASRVAFVVDGDKAGKDWAKQLSDTGVPAARIKMLPAGVSLEDLLDRNYYLRLVAEALNVDKSQLDHLLDAPSIKHAVSGWAKSRDLSMPGVVAFSEHILGLHERGERLIKLNSKYKRSLVALDSWALKTLSA
jgi:hypothetical protein